MDADSDDVAGANALRLKCLDGFINNDRIPERPRSRTGQDKKPSGRDNADTKRYITRIHQIDLHAGLPVSIRKEVQSSLGRRAEFPSRSTIPILARLYGFISTASYQRDSRRRILP